MKTELTFQEIQYLKSINHNVKIETPKGFSEITKVFEKELEGFKFIFDDNSEIKCARTHLMLSNNKWKSALDFKINNYLTDKFGNKFKKIKKIIPIKSQKWIDFEVKNKFQYYLQNEIIHHNSGKSAICYCILRFFFEKGIKVLTLVPSVSLTTQLYNDFKDYNAPDNFLNSIRLIGGDNNTKLLDMPVTITTWQSAQFFIKKQQILKESENEYIKNAKILSIKKRIGKFKKITYDDGSVDIVEI